MTVGNTNRGEPGCIDESSPKITPTQPITYLKVFAAANHRSAFPTHRGWKAGLMKSFLIAAFIAVTGMALQAAIRFGSVREKMVAYREEFLFVIFFAGAALVVSCLAMLLQQHVHVAFQRLRLGKMLQRTKK